MHQLAAQTSLLGTDSSHLVTTSHETSPCGRTAGASQASPALQGGSDALRPSLTRGHACAHTARLTKSGF